MNSFPWTRSTHTGIDLGARWIKAVEIETDGSIVRTARLPRGKGPTNESESSRACKLLRRQGFGLRQVTLLASSNTLRRQVIRLPESTDPLRDDAIIRNQFGDQEGEPGEASTIGWWELPRSCRPSDGREALAFECDYSSTEAWLNGFDAEGIRVRALDTHSSAMARVATDQDCVVADLGWSRVGLTLVVGGLPVYERSDSASGMASLIAAEAERTARTSEQVEAQLRSRTSDQHLHALPNALNWARVISESISATSDYGVRRYGLENAPRIWLTGGGATPEISKTICTLLGEDSALDSTGVEVDLIGAWAAARRWAA